MACLAADVTLDEAVKTSVHFTIIYVAVLYLPFNAGPRNSRATIMSRMATLTVLTLVFEGYIRSRLSHVSSSHSSETRVAAVAVGTLLTALLYTGHLLATPVFHPNAASWSERPYHALQTCLLSPLLEELVFRRQTLLIWSCQPEPWRLLFPAAMFALAHAHHIRWLDVAAVLFQLGYTFLFGVYAAALYVHTETVAAPFAAHVVCNVLELPDFFGISRHARRWIIITAYVISVMMFAVGFGPLTAMVRPRRIAFE